MTAVARSGRMTQNGLVGSSAPECARWVRRSHLNRSNDLYRIRRPSPIEPERTSKFPAQTLQIGYMATSMPWLNTCRRLNYRMRTKGSAAEMTLRHAFELAMNHSLWIPTIAVTLNMPLRSSCSAQPPRLISKTR